MHKVSLFIAVAALFVWFVAYVYTHGSRPLRRKVFANLDYAHSNGYFAPGECLADMTPDQVARDLALYSADFDAYASWRLEPYVREWLTMRGLL
jgi:hypothetical protein